MKEYSTGSDSSMVSVIVPAYNCSDYIEDTIRTVAEQTYTNWELILVDDKSTDDTAYAHVDKNISRSPLFRLN